MVPDFKEIKKAVHQIDPALSEDDEAFKAMAVLLSSAVCGPNVVKLKRFTSYPSDLLNKFAYRLRRNGIWKGARVYADWMDPEEGGAALILDSLVAQGMMERQLT